MTNIIANLIKNVIYNIIGRSYVQQIGVFFAVSQMELSFIWRKGNAI